MQIFAKGAAAFSCKIGRRVLTPVLLRPIALEVAFVYVATEDDTLFPDMPLLAPVVWTRETVLLLTEAISLDSLLKGEVCPNISRTMHPKHSNYRSNPRESKFENSIWRHPSPAPRLVVAWPFPLWDVSSRKWCGSFLDAVQRKHGAWEWNKTFKT